MPAKKPWTVVALLVALALSLLYFLRGVFTNIYSVDTGYILYALQFDIALVVLGIAAWLYLLRGKRDGCLLLVAYVVIVFIKYHDYVHMLDFAAYYLLLAALLLAKPSRLYYGLAKAGKGEVTPPIFDRNSAATVIIVLVLAFGVQLLLVELDQSLYIRFSQAEHEHILAYIDETYGNEVAEVNSAPYKQMGYVFLDLGGGRANRIFCRNGIITDEFVLDAWVRKYEGQFRGWWPDNMDFQLWFNAPGAENEKWQADIYANLNIPYSPRQNALEQDFYAEYAAPLYQAMCALVEDNFQVHVGVNTFSYTVPTPPNAFIRKHSLLFPFLNAEYDRLMADIVVPLNMVFDEICSEQEFYAQIKASIAMEQRYLAALQAEPL